MTALGFVVFLPMLCFIAAAAILVIFCVAAVVEWIKGP